MPDIENRLPRPALSEPETKPPTSPPLCERVLDLVALLVLIGLAAVVFTIAGSTAFTAVTSVGVGLFATWRTRSSRD